MAKKILIGLACLILAGLLAFGLQKSRREDAERSAALREINQQMDVLRARKLELEAELKVAKQELEESLKGMGTLTLLITDLSDDFVERITPVLQEVGLPAVMVLTQDCFTGDEGNVTLSWVQERLNDGWDYCVAYDGTENFDEWYNSMMELLESHYLNMPQALYFSEKSYTPELEKLALARNFSTIIHSGENRLPIVSVEVESPWRLGAIQWSLSKAPVTLDQAMAECGSVSFIVDQASFDASSFSSMLKSINQYQMEETLWVVTIEHAKAYRAEIVSQLEAARSDPGYDESVKALEEELESVNEQIQALLGRG